MHIVNHVFLHTMSFLYLQLMSYKHMGMHRPPLILVAKVAPISVIHLNLISSTKFDPIPITILSRVPLTALSACNSNLRL